MCKNLLIIAMSMHRLNLLVFLFVTMFFFNKVLGLCPINCDCSNAPGSCPIGVSLIMDGCGCCKMCAKQLNQLCSSDLHLCDPHKKLICDYSDASSDDWGICKAQRGRSCVHNGVLLVSGKTFEPSCKKECQCLDGSIACIMKCSHESEPPPAQLCPNARLESIEGQCCDDWVCDNMGLYDSEIQSVISNKADTDVVYDWNGGEDGDELTEQQIGLINPTSSTDESLYNWVETNEIPGEETYLSDREESKIENENNCPGRVSQWSECSKSCGLGISYRVTNVNPDCALRKETRLCMIRPCGDGEEAPTSTEVRRCNKQIQPEKHIFLSYGGCKSARSFKPRFCGTCANFNRCCSPRTTKTIAIRFQCRDGRTFYKNFMSIRTCRCSRQNCAASTHYRTSRQDTIASTRRPWDS